MPLTSMIVSPFGLTEYRTLCYGLLPNGESKDIDLTTEEDVKKVTNVFSDPSFSWSGTLFRVVMIWNEDESFNRIDFQTSDTPSGNIYTSWSEEAGVKIQTLKTLIESK